MYISLRFATIFPTIVDKNLKNKHLENTLYGWFIFKRQIEE